MKKTAQARVFHSKITSTRRMITIRFPTHSMEPRQCFQKLQSDHRWRRKFSKGRTSREVGQAWPMFWGINFEISVEIWRKRPRLRFFTLKSFLRVVRSQFVFLDILWNLGNVFKSYRVVIGDVKNFLRAEQVGKLVKDDLWFETWISKFMLQSLSNPQVTSRLVLPLENFLRHLWPRCSFWKHCPGSIECVGKRIVILRRVEMILE